MNAVATENPISNEQALIDLVLGKARSNRIDAQVSISRQEAWEAGVVNGSIEQLASSVSLKLSMSMHLPDGRFANVSSNDLQEASINALANDAIAMAEAGEADLHRGLPPVEKCGKAEVENLDDKGEGFNTERMLQNLLDTGSQAQSAYPHMIGSCDCSASRKRKRCHLVNTRCVDLVTTSTDYSISIELVAEQNGEKQRGYDSTRARRLRDLRPASVVAEIAARKAIRGFGWKKASSGPIGVVLDNNVASELIGVVKLLADGECFISKRSYWVQGMGKAIASAYITIIDDPLVRGGMGSRECDKEGVQAKALTIVERGTLRSVMTDTHSARKLNLPLTGHADGISNLILLPGSKSQDELLVELGTGFFVTGIQGHGIDITAGTWSKGASGFWVENGKIAHPVQGVTLAGKLDDIFKGVSAVGNDPKGDTDTISPSLLIPHGLTLGGE